MKDLIQFYNQVSSEFEETLQDRTAAEVAFDDRVIAELNKGKSIKQALNAAAKALPDEALQWTEDNIDEIAAYYEFLVNHEEIKSRISQISN